MAWGIGSNKTSNPAFRALQWRLLLSYSGVMVAILGASTGAVYEFFAHSLYQQLDNHLMTLADAAAHSLEVIKDGSHERHEEHEEDEDREEDKEAKEAKYENADKPPAENKKLMPRLDGDGDLDIPWQNLRQPDQGIEWYSEQGQLLAKEGTLFPTWELVRTKAVSGKTFQQGLIRTLTLPVYKYDSQGKQQELEGYVRISESAETVEAVLGKLQWGLTLGGAVAFALTAVGGMWLTGQSLKPIEQSFEQLKQFTADASHELRSPLTAIKTSVEVMQSHPERIHSADVKKVEDIASATNQMAILVGDLLLLARTDGSRSAGAVDWVSVPLEELLEDLVDFLELQAEEKGITLKSDLAADVFVKGDAGQLRRLFSNLLENALQYTSAGGTVTLSMTKLDRGVTVSVEDTGIGIAPEDVRRVFDRFWRADKARSRREGGSGLGLAIALAIARRHGGEITVTSQVGAGSCFRVRLPAV